MLRVVTGRESVAKGCVCWLSRSFLFLRSPAILLGFTILLLVLHSPAMSRSGVLHSSSCSAFPSYTSHIKLSTVYMYPHIPSWRHSEKRADSNQARAYKAKRRGIKLTRETALAREKRIFHFPHLVSPASLLQNRHSYRNFALFIPRGNEVTKTLVHTTS